MRPSRRYGFEPTHMGVEIMKKAVGKHKDKGARKKSAEISVRDRTCLRCAVPGSLCASWQKLFTRKQYGRKWARTQFTGPRCEATVSTVGGNCKNGQ